MLGLHADAQKLKRTERIFQSHRRTNVKRMEGKFSQTNNLSMQKATQIVSFEFDYN